MDPATGSLHRRLATAGVGLPLLLVVVWLGNPFVAALVAATAAVGAWEAAGLAAASRAPVLRLPVAVVAGVVGASGAADGGVVATVGGAGVLLLLVRASVGPSSLLDLVRPRGARPSPLGILRVWVPSVACVVYVGVPLACAALLRDLPFGLDWLLVAVLATFATDTGAYAAGRAFGRHKMAPGISPGKTWEGAAGGFIAAVLAAAVLVGLLRMPFHALGAVGLGAAIAVLSQAGDLAESKLKRLAGAKESGNLLPGHGGLLDRLDSLVPVFPLVYYVARVWPA